MTGWGGGAWGSSGWGFGGGGGGSPFQLLGAVAIAENVIRVTFSTVPNATGLGESTDALVADLYSVAPVVGTIGLDGEAPRAVSPIFVTVPPDVVIGTSVDITLDRPMSPYGVQYVLSVAPIVDVDGNVLDYATSTTVFYGQKQLYVPPSLDVAIPSRDIAHPDNLGAQLDPLPSAGDPLLLGGIPTDASGDYAFDEGITNYRKRCFRRIISRKDSYTHLRGYGAGVLDNLKQLSRSSARQKIAADVQAQIELEPETVKAKVMIVPDPNNAGLFWMRIYSKTVHFGALKFEAPLSNL